MEKKTDTPDHLLEFREWGLKTIYYAITVRDRTTNEAIDDPIIGKEAAENDQEIWEGAVAECVNAPTMLLRLYVSGVLRWSAQQVPH